MGPPLLTSLGGSASALIVDPSPSDAAFLASVLSRESFAVRVAHDFHRARALLDAHFPTVLAVEIRLGDYNGLQLVLHAANLSSAIATLVMARIHDPVLQRESEKMGATFFRKPISADEFRVAVYRTVARAANKAPELLRAPFERRTGDRRSHVAAVRVVVDRRTGERRSTPTIMGNVVGLASGES